MKIQKSKPLMFGVIILIYLVPFLLNLNFWPFSTYRMFAWYLPSNVVVGYRPCLIGEDKKTVLLDEFNYRPDLFHLNYTITSMGVNQFDISSPSRKPDFKKIFLSQFFRQNKIRRAFPDLHYLPCVVETTATIAGGQISKVEKILMVEL